MKVRPPSRNIWFVMLVLTIVFLIGYRVYLIFFETDYSSVHSQQLHKISSELTNQSQFEFAVVGNINNSVGVFEQKMIPMLNHAQPDFVVSAGNAVSSGGEDKYRALYRTLSNLSMPYLLTVGPHETEALGALHFYRHFGPFFYAYQVSNALLVFIDTTSEESFQFQLQWLDQQLSQSNATHKFVFMGQPMLDVGEESLIDWDDQYLQDPAFKKGLQRIFSDHKVNTVFSANLHLFNEQWHDGVRYVTTGGAGGLVLNTDLSYYHYVTVKINQDNVQVVEQRVEVGQHPLFKQIESLWFYVHSLFYVGHLNFLLIIALLSFIALKLYFAIFEEKHYYRNFNLNPEPYLNKPLKVCMITNNYLPFIGGVPLSIARLTQGLAKLGHNSLIIAPQYTKHKDRPSQTQPKPTSAEVVRIPSWLSMGQNNQFRLANPFSLKIRSTIKRFNPDIIHLHHPFWLGHAGLLWARFLKIPVVFTYHTRLEHYSHFVPLPGPLFRNLIAHNAIKYFANKCTGVIVPTLSAEEYLRLIGVKTPIYVHATGIDFDAYQRVSQSCLDELKSQHDIQPNQKVLISVARLSAEKNFEFLLNALALLKQKTDIAFKCLIIGDGDQKETIQAHIEQLGLTDQVTLVGQVTPKLIIDYYHLGDLFVFASRSETQGMVIIEAMAAGLPVVAVRSSGIDDVIDQGINGFKTPENHQAWSNAVKQCLKDDQALAKLANNAHQHAKEFDITQWAEEVHQTYAEVIALYHEG